MNCPRCGSEIQLSDPVCPKCGTRNVAYMPAQPEQQPYDQQYRQSYFPQPTYYVAPPANPSNGMAIAGFILSLIFAPWCLFFALFSLFTILGMIFSIIGLSKSKQLNGSGRGLAIAGIVISAISIFISIMSFAALAALMV
ncbi:MAG: zinc-ribbon domain-containing protein [Clostridiales bacterium]|nr:zinc-ribbon domain-containing protein [Clostridiales bacterium]